MENNYFINETLIKDIECKHKERYNKYCLSCEKNICDMCKGHENHRKIEFNSIEPEQRTYEEFKKNLSEMNYIGEDIKKKYNKIIQIKDLVVDLYTIINKSLQNLKNYVVDFENHLKFNNVIFNSYKNNKRNYYILNNFNSLTFMTNIESKYNDLNIKKIENLINKIADSNEKNMWISEKYCKNWGLREGIREFIQNQYDGIITKIESKKNLKVNKVGGEYLNDGKKIYLEYDFLKKGENKIYGKIRYNENKKILSISNEGELFLGDFLLGGSKEEQNNSDLIGAFGEGMKLAILALCRLKKDVTIISSNKKYNFVIKEDINFTKNSIPQKCLHCKIEDYNSDEMKDQVKVLIKNIEKEEWVNQVDNFLWLIDDVIEKYTSLDKNNNEIGQIIYESRLKNKLYVKGIFVQDLEKNPNYQKEAKENIPGFNADLKIDRDRNCVQSISDLKTIIANIISGTFNKNIDYLRDYQQKTGYKFTKTEYGFIKTEGKGDETEIYNLKYLTKNVVNCLQSDNLDIIDYYDLGYNLSKESIEIIWNEMYLDKENENKQPTTNSRSITEFIHEKKLPEKFYEYYNVRYKLFHILEKSQSYKSIEKKFAEYAENAINIEPTNEYKNALKDIYSKVKLKMKDFDDSLVKFKKFTNIDKDFCFKNNNEIYFSSDKLNENLTEEWKFWVFIKILNISDIKIENSYSLFHSVF